MPAASLPKPTIFIADHEPAKLARDAELAVKNVVANSMFLKRIGMPDFCVCKTPRELEVGFKKHNKAVEPCVCITDSIGLLNLKQFRSELPYMKVLFYTQSKNAEELVELMESGIINQPLRKSDPTRMQHWVGSLYEEYWNQSVLQSIRAHITDGSRNPKRKCYRDPETSKLVNLFEIYDQVRLKTALGKRLEELWRLMDAIGDG